MLWETVGPRAVPQESNLAEPRAPINLLAVDDVRHCQRRTAVDVLSIQPMRSIPTPWNAHSRVKTDEVAPGEPVANAPDLSLRVAEKIGGGGFAPGSLIETGCDKAVILVSHVWDSEAWALRLGSARDKVSGKS
jgi:hypothetical protein